MLGVDVHVLLVAGILVVSSVVSLKEPSVIPLFPRRLSEAVERDVERLHVLGEEGAVDARESTETLTRRLRLYVSRIRRISTLLASFPLNASLRFPSILP